MSDEGPRATKNGNGNGGDLDDLGFDDGLGTNGLAPPRTLGDLWRESVLFKIMVVGGVLAVAIIAIMLFASGGRTTPTPSAAPKGSTVRPDPGGSTNITDEDRDRLDRDQARDRLDAAQAGQTFIAPIFEAPGGRAGSPDMDTAGDTPLDRWRRMRDQQPAPEALRPPPQIAQTPQPAQPDPRLAELAGAMSEQMAAVLEVRSAPAELGYQVINSKSWIEGKRKEEAQAAAAAAQAQAQAQAQAAAGAQTMLLPAGTIEYGQMLVEANSDVPGPVLAQVASGPLKGARLIGQFSVESDKYLAITFSTAVVDGQAISINAIALDPGTTLPGMATDIDNRYLTRVILPAAAAFVEGWTQAVADSGATTVTVSGDTVIDESNPTTNTQEVNAGIAEAGAEIGDILSDIADDTEVMVKVAAGTPMGVLFLSPVVESEATLITPEMQMEERRRLEEREAFGAALGDRFGQTERRVDGRMDDRRMDDLDRRLEDAQDRGYRYMVY